RLEPANDATENRGGWVTALPHGINTEKTGGSAPRSTLDTFAGAPVPGADAYLRSLIDRRGEERARELIGSEIQLMIFPNFFIQPRRQHFRVLRPVAVDRTARAGARARPRTATSTASGGGSWTPTTWRDGPARRGTVAVAPPIHPREATSRWSPLRDPGRFSPASRRPASIWWRASPTST